MIVNAPGNLNSVWKGYEEIAGVEAAMPSEKEIKTLATSLDTMFTVNYKNRSTNIILQRYWTQAIFAMGISKTQLKASFAGQFVKSGQFVITPIYSGYMGYNTWLNDVAGTQGALANWIDNTTPPNASPATGVPLGPAQVGAPIGCHLVVGFEGYSSNPSVERVNVEKGGDEFSAIDIEPYKGLQFKGLKTPFFFVGGSQNDQLLMNAFLASGVADSIAPRGISFLTSVGAKLRTPQAMAGATMDSLFKY